MPPDWIYAHEKDRKRQEWEAEKASLAEDEQSLREEYRVERNAALQAYLLSPEGRRHYAAFHPIFLEFYRTIEPERFREAAREAATGKVEREHFQFPTFGVWHLERREIKP
jgi:hypothetical protein